MEPGSVSHLRAALAELAQQTGLEEGEVILKWAHDTLSGIIVTSTSKAERAQKLMHVLGDPGQSLQKQQYDLLEAAAKEDGYEGKVFYKHAHMKT